MATTHVGHGIEQGAQREAVDIAPSAEPRRPGPAVLGSAGGLACFPTGARIVMHGHA